MPAVTNQPDLEPAGNQRKDVTMLRRSLRPLVSAARSALGTNGVAERISEIERQLKALSGLDGKLSSVDGKLQVSLRELDKLVRFATPAAPATGFATLSLPSGRTYELSVDVADQDSYHHAVAGGGAHDTNWQFIMKWIRPGDVFLDVGANIGTISIPAAMIGANVHSFELLSSNVHHLLQSVGRNEISTMSVTLGAVSSGHVPVGISGVSAWATVVESATLSVATVVLDEYIQARGLAKIELMKIDVEGSELSALSGAKTSIEQFGPNIVIEGNVVTSGNAGYSYRELLQFLEDRGYGIYRLYEDGLRRWDNKNVQEVVVADYFASRHSADYIRARAGWHVSTMSNSEIISSIESQSGLTEIHKQYIAEISHALPSEVVAAPRVKALLSQWININDDNVRKVLLTGSK